MRVEQTGEHEEEITVADFGCYGTFEHDVAACVGKTDLNGRRTAPACAFASSCRAVTSQQYVKKIIPETQLVRSSQGRPAQQQPERGPSSQAAPQAAASMGKAPSSREEAIPESLRGKVYYQPVTQEMAGQLAVEENRRPGRKMKAAVREASRAALKGAFGQLASFVNNVPWGDGEDDP
jgi:hypothetical protein